jgi:hypothetical protein
MPLIIKMTPVGKRAHNMPQAEIDKMLDNGTAKQCAGYEFYEEVTPEEISQGYMTRNMEALPVPRRPGRPPKAAVAEPVVEDTPAAK